MSTYYYTGGCSAPKESTPRSPPPPTPLRHSHLRLPNVRYTGRILPTNFTRPSLPFPQPVSFPGVSDSPNLVSLCPPLSPLYLGVLRFLLQFHSVFQLAHFFPLRSPFPSFSTMATDQASTSHPPPAVNPPPPPPPHLALYTQTIAAPLHFAGNDPVLAGELSACLLYTSDAADE